MNLPSCDYIGSSAFRDCKNLEHLVIGSGVEEIDQYTFNSCEGFEGELLVPDNVKILGKHVFNNTGFESLILGSGLESIEQGAFFGMKNLKSITKPEGLSLDQVAGNKSIFGGTERLYTVPTGFTDTEIEEYLYNQSRYANILSKNLHQDNV